MGRPSLSIEVKRKDMKQLTKLLNGGVQQVRVVMRALAPQQLAKGISPPRISDVLPLTAQAIPNIGHRYWTGGLDAALYDKQRPGADASSHLSPDRCLGVSLHGAQTRICPVRQICTSGRIYPHRCKTVRDAQASRRDEGLIRKSTSKPASVSMLTSVSREKRLILPRVKSEILG